MSSDRMRRLSALMMLVAGLALLPACETQDNPLCQENPSRCCLPGGCGSELDELEEEMHCYDGRCLTDEEADAEGLEPGDRTEPRIRISDSPADIAGLLPGAAGSKP